MYFGRLPLFLGIGVLAVPIAVAVTLLQALVFRASDVIGLEFGGERGGLLVAFVVSLGIRVDAARARDRPGGYGEGARRDRRGSPRHAVARVPAGPPISQLKAKLGELVAIPSVSAFGWYLGGIPLGPGAPVKTD